MASCWIQLSKATMINYYFLCLAFYLIHLWTAAQWNCFKDLCCSAWPVSHSCPVNPSPQWSFTSAPVLFFLPFFETHPHYKYSKSQFLHRYCSVLMKAVKPALVHATDLHMHSFGSFMYASSSPLQVPTDEKVFFFLMNFMKVAQLLKKYKCFSFFHTFILKESNV